ncbi:MAG: hypothetical protein Aurels2KO_38880 [Aureliella sp.]
MCREPIADGKHTMCAVTRNPFTDDTAERACYCGVPTSAWLLLLQILRRAIFA